MLIGYELLKSESISRESDTNLDLIKSFSTSVTKHKNTLVKKTKGQQGRPKGIPPEKLLLIHQLRTRHQDLTILELCKLANISRPTYYKYLKGNALRPTFCFLLLKSPRLLPYLFFKLVI